MKLITNKEELIKELKEIYDFLDAPDEKITNKYSYVLSENVDSFKVGYIRSEIKYLISDLKSEE